MYVHKQKPGGRNYKENQAGSLTSLFIYEGKAHLLKKGAAHNGLIPPTSSSIKQDNPSQTWPQIKLI